MTMTKDDIWPEEWSAEWRQAADEGDCIHCGNPLGRFWKHEDGPFCCRGCKGVYEMIHQEDLCRFYDLSPDTHAPASALRTESFGWLDRLVEERGAAGPIHLDLDIQGVHCAACIWLIEELFKRHDAGIQLRINPTLGKVDLSWDQSAGDLKVFLAEIEKFGYRLGPSRKGDRKASRDLLMRMAIAIAMALNVMMFSLSIYFGLGESALFSFFGWLSLGMATISLLAGGGIFLKGAVAGLQRGVLHLDVPISLGMILAYAGSTYGFLTGGPENAYFDSLTIFIALMLVGRWAQEHILERNRNTLLESSGAENITVKKLQNGSLATVSADEIVTGDELWIAPGDLLPVAGILMRRSTQVSLDWITGESDQVAFQPGDTIAAGAFNASNHGFSVTATENFADSRLQDLLRSTTVSDDEFRPRWWHTISSWYVAVVLSAALLGFGLWAGRDLTMALKVTISILVVTCPCALGLATPLAEELIHFALRRSGVFIRKQSFMEKALSVQKVLLDKTGTLTMGQLELDDASQQAVRKLDDQAAAVLQHMTARSNHPVSMCLAVAVGRRQRPQGQAIGGAEGEELDEIQGSGLELVLGETVWRLGKPEFALSAAAEASAQAQHTVLSQNGQKVAGFLLREEFKADAADEVASLLADGYEIHLLSGDGQTKVDAAAVALGLDPAKCEGGLSPEAKAKRVRELDADDTLMVGDGLNDSPSFEVAFCAATPAIDRPVLPGKADFFFLGDGIASLRRSLAAAEQLRRVVKDNLVIAIVYNVGAVALCLTGLVTPVVAAILMPLSSVTVVSLTAIRLSPGRLKWI
ncbi:MAG: heavy metal translocating P-type ATPase metal-binding domain-containing protein [Candidatus Krumholzibacteria bacterium]|nr:heavy metal translocating P-type ATPase metal-binding domain-containing protein [Candidatus Krumholzibacteria bacterium]